MGDALATLGKRDMEIALRQGRELGDHRPAVTAVAAFEDLSVAVAGEHDDAGVVDGQAHGAEDGALSVRADGSLNIGPSQVHAGKGKDAMAAMPIPAKYRVVPEKTPAGQPYNVAQAYARAADALRGRGAFDVDFDLAVRRHALIDAIERSSSTGRSVKLE